MPTQLMPLLILFVTALAIVGVRRTRVALAGRRDRRAKAEAAEYARITGWISKIRPDGVGPAVQRDRRGRVVLFAGLRRYTRGGRRARRGQEV